MLRLLQHAIHGLQRGVRASGSQPLFSSTFECNIVKVKALAEGFYLTANFPSPTLPPRTSQAATWLTRQPCRQASEKPHATRKMPYMRRHTPHATCHTPHATCHTPHATGSHRPPAAPSPPPHLDDG